MPSNKDLIADILKLDESATVDGLNNNALVDLLATLTDGSDDDITDDVDESLPPFSVAAGKSILTKRGILADGDEITADDLPMGDKTVKHFVKTGHIVKN